MRCKIGANHKYLFIGWLCLLMFAASQMGYAALKIYYVQVGDAFWENTLWQMDANGNNKELFLEPPVPMMAPEFSPDGKQILFTTMKVGGNKSKLMVMDSDSSNLRELLAVPPRHSISGAKWSPDGKWIAYHGFEPNQRPFKEELFVTDAQGLRSFQIVPDLEDEDHVGSYNWFPYSKRLAISIAKPFENGKLHWIDAVRNAKPEVMDVELFANSIHWSPNGERTIITGSIRPRGKALLFLGDALGKNLIRLDNAEETNRVQWLPDSKHIVYGSVVWNRANDVVEVDVTVMNVDTQVVHRLTDDGRSQFVFWHDPTFAVEAAGKLSTSWGAIKVQVIDANK